MAGRMFCGWETASGHVMVGGDMGVAAAIDCTLWRRNWSLLTLPLGGLLAELGGPLVLVAELGVWPGSARAFFRRRIVHEFPLP